MAHAEYLRNLGTNNLEVEQIKDDWRQMDLTQAETTMLEYVEKLTLTPYLMTETDVDKLRQVGWTDADILDIVQVCAYFNFRVRMVDGLGLELSEEHIEQARAGAKQARALAEAGEGNMPEDRWKVR